MTEIISESKMGVERVKKIVEDLRKFSRLDEAEIKRIDLGSTIDSTLTIVKSEIAKKNIQFSFDSTQKIMVDCYPGQLNQAILNVLVNAIQAVDNGGKILLQIKEEENQVMISVEDNGIGIPKQNMSKIFDPFFSTKPVGSGTGLGLSITDKIINDLHKGKIDVYSEVDKGTIFKLMIPKEIKK
jgi:signal transduction histidine kinase